MITEKHLCRRCEHLASLHGKGRRPFVLHNSKPQYAPDRLVRLEHLRLEIELDPRVKAFEATAHERFRVVSSGEKSIRLDQNQIEIKDARIGGESVRFETGEGYVRIELPEQVRKLAEGETFELSVRYRVENPRRGIYFTGPDTDYPKKPWQTWTQSQDEDCRHWIPIPDYPNQKATTEIIATVPKGFTAVSNGALVSQKDEGSSTRFHYSLGTPQVTYLISLVVAEFSTWEDLALAGKLPVQYFVQPGREADGKRAFSATPRMVDAFSARTGVPYAYEKYSQVAVQDFIFGGMENTSATTQTERTLHDERAHLDVSSDPLVSHELAHQWFGDLVTCREWSHGWLNEGFATFMERVWVENDIERFGSKEVAAEEAKYYQYADLQEYLAEDGGRYRRPIVCRNYVEPIDLFDTHLYQKGGLVLNLIRATLGEEKFWKSVKLYLERHRGGSVETMDLVRAIEDATGRNLRRLFDQWVFSAGYPELEVTYSWHEDRKLVELVIEQKQTGGEKEKIVDGFVTPLFQLDLTLELVTDDSGKVERHPVVVAEARDRFFLPASAKPRRVRLDPGNTIPKTMKFPRPKEMLLDQLTQDCDCMGRIEAAKELAKLGDPAVISALARAVASDAFWGVRVEAAAALGEIRTDAAREALIASLAPGSGGASGGTENPKVRRAVVKALSGFRDERAAEAVKPLAERDPSYLVEAEATLAYAKTRSLNPALGEATEAFLIQQLAKDSHLEVIRAAALSALSDLPGVYKGDRPLTLQTLKHWIQRGRPEDARLAAIGSVGRIAKVAVPALRQVLLSWLDQLADEDSFRIRSRLVPTLVETGAMEMLGALDRIQRSDMDGRIRRQAQVGRQQLLEGTNEPESIEKLRSALEKLEEEHRKLRSRVDETVIR